MRVSIVVQIFLPAETLRDASRWTGVTVNYGSLKAYWSIEVLSTVSLTFTAYWFSCMSCWQHTKSLLQQPFVLFFYTGVLNPFCYFIPLFTLTSVTDQNWRRHDMDGVFNFFFYHLWGFFFSLVVFCLFRIFIILKGLLLFKLLKR